MIEDVAMEDEVADIALIARSHDDLIIRLDEQRVLPGALEVCVLRIVALPGGAHVVAARIEYLDHLERIHVNMERVTDRPNVGIDRSGQRPFVDAAEEQRPVDTIRVVRFAVDRKLETRARVYLELGQLLPPHLA